jgi:hypothetical protein
MTRQRRQGNRFSSFPLSLLYLYFLPSSHPCCFPMSFICSFHRQSPLLPSTLPLLHINTSVSPPFFLFVLLSPYILPTVFVSQLAYYIYPVVIPLLISQPRCTGGFPEDETNWLLLVYRHLNWPLVHKYEQISYRCVLFILAPRS